MAANCTCRGSGVGTVITAGPGAEVTGSGTPTNPYVVSTETAVSPFFRVQDSDTVNLTLYGAGIDEDPYVLKADSDGAMALTGLSDVSSTDLPRAGDSPTWTGASTGGHWEFKPNGVRYCTVSTRPDPADCYQGLQIRETDTGKRYEWDGTGWLDITPAGSVSSVPTGSLTGVIADANLPPRLGSVGQILTNTDLNTVLTTGWYRGIGLGSAPGAGWYYYEILGHNSSYATQIAHDYLASGPTWRRVLNNGVWSPWDRVLSTSQTNAGVLDSRYPLLSGGKIAVGVLPLDPRYPVLTNGQIPVSTLPLDSRYPTLSSSGQVNRGVLPFKYSWGSVVFPTTGWTAANGGYERTLAVSLPALGWSSTPQIFVQPHTAASQNQHWGVINATTSGFNFYYWRNADTGPSGGVFADWFAIGS